MVEETYSEHDDHNSSHFVQNHKDTQEEDTRVGVVWRVDDRKSFSCSQVAGSCERKDFQNGHYLKKDEKDTAQPNGHGDYFEIHLTMSMQRLGRTIT